MINPYQAKYFAYELSKKATAESPEKFGATLMDAKVELNPHQIEAALFAFKSPYSKGIILADEVGLGKTIEAGILLSQKWAEGKRRILIICPSSLRKQWVNEMADKFYLKAEVLETPSFNRKVKNGVRNPFDSTDSIKVCSYHFARRRADEIMLTSWDLIVIDEAHYLRNVYKPRNITAKAIQRATRDYKKVLLTATPLQNRLEELYGLVSFIDPDLFGDIKAFRKKYVLESGNQDIGALKLRLKDIVHRTLRRDVREFINYRERVSLTQEFQPSPKEMELYESVLEFLRRDNTYAFPLAQKHLMQSVLFKLLGSSSFAIGRTLEALVRRLEKLLVNSKVVDDELYEMFLEEYENYDDEIDEIEEDQEKYIEEELNEITFEDKLAIEEEIVQLKSFLLLANSIEHNEKGEKLLMALESGFEKLEELGANKKALIFTESTRTQKYLFERLSKEKFAGRILLFNGSNNDDVSKEIYQAWKEDERNIDKVTGSRSVDIRHALVDAFESDDFDIMIGTEAAGEGINLQFCSMVVNYDLPWNPQRVEQRIGRCHRYGQKFDVVVVNFINGSNAVERRVYELLESKFKLFEGVFGASDEILGSIESGMDFEKRIAEVYKKCRTQEEIEEYFNELQEEFKEQIDARVKQVQSQLFENFEYSVIEKLRYTLSETLVFIEKYEKWLWELTRYYLKNKAQFIFDDYTFILNNGERYTLNKGRKDAKRFFINGNVAQEIINLGKKEATPNALLQFDLLSSNIRNSEVEQLKSPKGQIRINNLEVSSEIETHSVLLFAGITDEGERLSDENCRYILGLDSTIASNSINISPLLEEVFIDVKKERLAYLEATDAALMQREFKKFHNWADDKLEVLEDDLKEARKKVREMDHASMEDGLSAHEVLEAQERLSRAKKKVRKLRNELYEREEEIEEERDEMIKEAKEKLDRIITDEEIFTIGFELMDNG